MNDAKYLRDIERFSEEEWHSLVDRQDPKLLYAPHCNKNGRFFNPWLIMEFNLAMLKSAVSYFRTKPKLVPEELNFQHVENTNYKFDKSISTIAFLGHASFVISMDNSLILTDPFFTKFAAFMKKSVNVKVDYSSFPKEPVVLISHNHYDHLDRASIKHLVKKGAIFIVPLKLKNYFLKLGVKKVYELDWWQEIEINDIKYTFLPSQHWSSRVGQPINSTLWGSYMIQGSKTIYFSGDTGYFVGYREYGKVFKNIDYALLGVGAYHPRWQRYYQHQSVDEFFMALKDLNAKVGIPMHYGTIRLGKESIDFPAYEVEMKTDESMKKHVKIMKIGEVLDMNSYMGEGR